MANGACRMARAADLPQVPNCSHETDGDKDESEEQLVQRASACTYLMVLGPLFLLLFRSFFLLRFRQGCTIAARLAALIGGCSPLARLFGHRRIVLGGCRSPGQLVCTRALRTLLQLPVAWRSAVLCARDHLLYGGGDAAGSRSTRRSAGAFV